MISCNEILSIDANQLSLQAEQKRDFAILANANALRVKVKEKEKTVKELDKALVNLEWSKKNVEFSN